VAGTQGSNPSSSTGESGANLASIIVGVHIGRMLGHAGDELSREQRLDGLCRNFADLAPKSRVSRPGPDHPLRNMWRGSCANHSGQEFLATSRRTSAA
jgi:hypothetical protein